MKQLFFISLLYSTLVNAQNPAQGYEDYKAISNDAKTVSFFDDFIDNANQWEYRECNVLHYDQKSNRTQGTGT